MNATRRARLFAGHRAAGVTFFLLVSPLACTGESESTSILRVEQKPLVSTVLLSGTIRTAEAIELLAPMIDMWPIPIQTILEDGTAVTAGQAIAEFDSSNLATGLQASQDRVVEAETNMLTTRARLDAEEADARFDVESKRLLLKKAKLEAAIPEGLKPEREFQTLQLDLRRAELEHKTALTKLSKAIEKAAAEVGIARVEVSKAHTEVNRTEQSLEVVVLSAPHDGIVEVAYNRDEGRPYRSGDNAQPGMPVARFPDYTTLRVEAFLFDVDQGLVERGSEASVLLDAYPEQRFAGTVTDVQEIAQEVNSRSSRRVFRMYIDLEEPDPKIMKVGMSTRVEIRTQLTEWHGQPTLVVPRAALDFSLTDKSQSDGTVEDAAAAATISARLRTPNGEIPTTVGRCSLRECVVIGPNVGQEIALITTSPVSEASS